VISTGTKVRLRKLAAESRMFRDGRPAFVFPAGIDGRGEMGKNQA